MVLLYRGPSRGLLAALARLRDGAPRVASTSLVETCALNNELPGWHDQRRGFGGGWITSDSVSDASSASASGASMDEGEVRKFGDLSERWWDPDGPFAPLQALNPTRVRFIKNALCANFGLERNTYEPLRTLEVLDVGCGGGLLTESLARLGARVYGIDAASDSVAAAAAHARADASLEGRWAYRAATAEDLVEAGAAFDAVIASEVIEHVANPPAFCGSLAALTRPGGALVVSTLNRTLPAYLLAVLAAERLAGLVPVGTHEWSRFVTPEELTMMMESAGELVPGGGRMVLKEVAGMMFQPLSGRWQLDGNMTDINYIAYWHKEAAAAAGEAGGGDDGPPSQTL